MAAEEISNSRKKTILLVEDDLSIRLALETILKKEGFEVEVTEDGITAQNYVSLKEYDLVLSDIHLPGSRIGGIELLEFIQRTQPSIPVVLMTGFAALSETQNAFNLGAKGFLAKPFKKAELIDTIRGLLPEDAEPLERVEEDLDQHYCRLSIDDFVSGKEIRYAIYIRLSATKYVKVAHEGENIDVGRVRAYREKGIKHLYLERKNFLEYIQFSLGLSQLVTKTNLVSREKGFNLLKHTGELIMEQLYSQEIDENLFPEAKNLIESTVEFLSASEDSVVLLEALSSHSDHLYAHSLGVSLYASLIAKKMKWNSTATQYKVSIAGLMHDVGKKELPQELINKSRSKYDHTDIQLYETHPTRGAEILARMSSMPADVLQIVAHHHERDSGTGYPYRLTKGKIHPLAKLIAVADEFCKFAIKNPDHQGSSPKEAYKRLMMLQSNALDANFLKVLGEVVGIQSL